MIECVADGTYEVHVALMLLDAQVSRASGVYKSGSKTIAPSPSAAIQNKY